MFIWETVTFGKQLYPWNGTCKDNRHGHSCCFINVVQKRRNLHSEKYLVLIILWTGPCRRWLNVRNSIFYCRNLNLIPSYERPLTQLYMADYCIDSGSCRNYDWSGLHFIFSLKKSISQLLLFMPILQVWFHEWFSSRMSFLGLTKFVFTFRSHFLLKFSQLDLSLSKLLITSVLTTFHWFRGHFVRELFGLNF